MARWLCVSVVFVIVSMWASCSLAYTLEQVRKRDELVCGVTPGMPGFSMPDTEGRWTGLHVDFCRAVAAATLGSSEKVKFVALTENNRITALQSGEVDLLSMHVPWTMTGDTSLGVHFIGISYFDGQGFLLQKRKGVGSALELTNPTICVEPGGAAERNLASFFREHDISYKTVAADDKRPPAEQFSEGSCEVLSDSLSRLYELRLAADAPERFIVLPETISREPVGPIVRQGDDAWFNIVRWTLFAMLVAEEKKVSSTTIETIDADGDQEMKVLAGLDGDKSRGLGLNGGWTRRIILQVGNYGEVFARNLGVDSALKMDRGLNNLWNRGGLHFPPALD